MTYIEQLNSLDLFFKKTIGLGHRDEQSHKGPKPTTVAIYTEILVTRYITP